MEQKSGKRTNLAEVNVVEAKHNRHHKPATEITPSQASGETGDTLQQSWADQNKSEEKKAAKCMMLVSHSDRHRTNKPAEKDDRVLLRDACPLCGSKFSSRSQISRHLVSAHSDDDRSLWPFPCRFCDERLLTFAQMRQHERDVHPEECRPFPCQTCGKRFMDQNGLHSHQFNVHVASAKRFTCDVCGKRYCHRSKVVAHRRRCHENERPHGCPFCDKRFYLATHLNVHLLQHLRIQLHACPVCRRTFYQKSNLGKHMQYHHPEALPPEKTRGCEALEYGGSPLSSSSTGSSDTTEKRTKLLQHQHPEAVLLEKARSCEVVEYRGKLDASSSTRRSDTTKRGQTDLQYHHPEALPLEKALGCELVEYGSKLDALSSTGSSHVIKKASGSSTGSPDGTEKGRTPDLVNYQCDRCDACCGSGVELQKHQMVKHPLSVLTYFGCAVCGSHFPTYTGLNKHRKDTGHGAEMVFVCDVCEDVFPSGFRLRVHRLRHLAERPFLCRRCGRRFRTQRRIDRHVLRHPDVRSYSCPRCGTAYYSAHLLSAHMLRHFVTNPVELAKHRDRLRAEQSATSSTKQLQRYLCSECGRECRTSQALRVHYMDKHVNQYSCGECGKYSRQSAISVIGISDIVIWN